MGTLGRHISAGSGLEVGNRNSTMESVFLMPQPFTDAWIWRTEVEDGAIVTSWEGGEQHRCQNQQL